MTKPGEHRNGHGLNGANGSPPLDEMDLMLRMWHEDHSRAAANRRTRVLDAIETSAPIVNHDERAPVVVGAIRPARSRALRRIAAAAVIVIASLALLAPVPTGTREQPDEIAINTIDGDVVKHVNKNLDSRRASAHDLTAIRKPDDRTMAADVSIDHQAKEQMFGVESSQPTYAAYAHNYGDGLAEKKMPGAGRLMPITLAATDDVSRTANDIVLGVPYIAETFGDESFKAGSRTFVGIVEPVENVIEDRDALRGMPRLSVIDPVVAITVENQERAFEVSESIFDMFDELYAGGLEHVSVEVQDNAVVVQLLESNDFSNDVMHFASLMNDQVGVRSTYRFSYGQSLGEEGDDELLGLHVEGTDVQLDVLQQQYKDVPRDDGERIIVGYDLSDMAQGATRLLKSDGVRTGGLAVDHDVDAASYGDLLYEFVEPESWEFMGGDDARQHAVGSVLYVHAPTEMQNETAKFFAVMRSASGVPLSDSEQAFVDQQNMKWFDVRDLALEERLRNTEVALNLHGVPVAAAWSAVENQIGRASSVRRAGEISDESFARVASQPINIDSAGSAWQVLEALGMQIDEREPYIPAAVVGGEILFGRHGDKYLNSVLAGFELVPDGEIIPPVFRAYDLSDYLNVHRWMESGSTEEYGIWIELTTDIIISIIRSYVGEDHWLEFGGDHAQVSIHSGVLMVRGHVGIHRKVAACLHDLQNPVQLGRNMTVPAARAVENAHTPVVIDIATLRKKVSLAIGDVTEQAINDVVIDAVYDNWSGGGTIFGYSPGVQFFNDKIVLAMQASDVLEAINHLNLLDGDIYEHSAVRTARRARAQRPEKTDNTLDVLSPSLAALIHNEDFDKKRTIRVVIHLDSDSNLEDPLKALGLENENVYVDGGAAATIFGASRIIGDVSMQRILQLAAVPDVLRISLIPTR